MSIDEIVQAWKTNEETADANIPANPIGEELSEEDLQQVVGGMWCVVTCDLDWTCSIGCYVFGTNG